MVSLLGAFIDAAYALVVLRRPRRVACSGKSDQGLPAAPAGDHRYGTAAAGVPTVHWRV